MVYYLETPPNREKLLALLALMKISPRELLRCKGTPFDELNLDNPLLSDDQLIDAMMAQPILINRPIAQCGIFFDDQGHVCCHRALPSTPELNQ